MIGCKNKKSRIFAAVLIYTIKKTKEMKKNAFVLMAALVLLSLPSSAQEAAVEDQSSTSIEVSDIGISTGYLWRGQMLSGLNLQGDLSWNYEQGDFSASLGTWFIHAFQENLFGPFMTNGYQEWDLYANAAYKGLSLTVTDYMMAPYFSKGFLGEGHAVDATLEYYISDDIPLTFSWNTIFAGGDDMEEANGLKKRFYSSWFETDYDFSFGEFPVDFTASVGLVPWTSPYIDDAEGAHVAWLGLCGSYEIPTKGDFGIPTSLSLGVNPTDATFLWSLSLGF